MQTFLEVFLGTSEMHETGIRQSDTDNDGGEALSVTSEQAVDTETQPEISPDEGTGFHFLSWTYLKLQLQGLEKVESMKQKSTSPSSMIGTVNQEDKMSRMRLITRRKLTKTLAPVYIPLLWKASMN